MTVYLTGATVTNVDTSPQNVLFIHFVGGGRHDADSMLFLYRHVVTCETNLLFLKMVAINLSNDLVRLNEKKKRMLGK